MNFIPCTTDGIDHLATLRRLIVSRWIVLGCTALLALIAPGVLDVPLSQPPLLAILGVGALFNALTAWRLARSEHAAAIELFSQLLFDMSILSGLLFFSGGATNPLVSLLLPPVAIAALTLPGRCVLGIGLAAIGAYSLLMFFYLPLPLPDATRATKLHLIGMWLTFAVSATMIAWFVVRMTALIRQRDGELAAAREQALRDERVMAMGTLAAGAAHELGTPLGTMALIAGELAREFENKPDIPDSVREDITLLRQQIAVCKQIMTGLSRRAGAERLENTARVAVDRWLETVRQHWAAVRPQANSTLQVSSTGQPPQIAADPRLEQALLNLLNNAANATPQVVQLQLNWDTTQIRIEIRDRGPGFPAEILARAGQASSPSHAGGSGIGLMLTRSALEQLGGRLILINPEDGGALARIELPVTVQ
jgi:two-component system sensor histidine kinase RegB